MARLGILGGTFNPPHIGHLLCAAEAHGELGLDRVLLMPVHAPPHKDAPQDPGVEHRLELCRRAIAGDDRLEVSRLEADRDGRSFTVDTLQALHEQAPEDQLIFIVGGDMARTFPSWRDPERALELATLAVAEREDATGRDDVIAALGPLAAGDRVVFFDMPRVDVSSSLVRSRVGEGRPIRYLVPDGVAAYIEEHGLYRAGAPAGARA